MKIEPRETVVLTAEEARIIRKAITVLCDLSEELELPAESIFDDLHGTNFNTIFSSDYDYPVIIEY